LGENSKTDLSKLILRIIEEKKPKNIRQLTKLVKEISPNQESEIFETILNLQKTGKIKLEHHQSNIPSTNFRVYLSSNDAFWYWSIVAITFFAFFAVLLIPEDYYPWIYVRNIFGTIFVLWLPGFTFFKTLFPKKLSTLRFKENYGLEQIIFSVGLSLSLVSIVGLLLNFTPWGIRLVPLVLILLILTMIFATTALLKEYDTNHRQNKKWNDLND